MPLQMQISCDVWVFYLLWFACFWEFFSHVVLLICNYVATKYIMRAPEAEMKALVMVCSQKSEVISLAVLPRLPALGDPGLLTIGFLMIYLPMLIIDGFIAYYWAKAYDHRIKSEKETKPY
eukprot:TRINITY_DN720_c0_g1_i1.p1 TRINITY_DN720_c0_g1~~TRINITY_DN720_c0_g1_i1.p1  ORF type:complete len:121 (+),score=13.09 TRINITY_DN720_c0_g1_i1:30-392(+)